MWISKQAWAENKRHQDYLENEVKYWREKAESDRRRADRLHDRLLMMTGQPAVTDEVIEEDQSAQLKVDEENSRRMHEMSEIFSESLEELEDLEVPEDMKEEVEGLLKG